MSYRQLLKATNSYVKNEKFKSYLKLFYQQNKQSKITSDTVKAWIRLMKFLYQKRSQKIVNKQVEDKINLSSLFIKHPVWSLNQQQYRQLTANVHSKNSYNIYMICQVHYLWKEKKLFGKKIAKNMEHVENLINRQKTLQIDSSQKIIFV